MDNRGQDEKELRKREEKAPQEKQFDEKYRRDPLGALVWPLILIWAGLVFLAANLGYLDWMRGRDIGGPAGIFWTGANAWSLIMLGAGVIILLEVAVRLAVPAYRRPVTGSVILAIIFIGVGLGNLTNWDILWPLILIVIGAGILIGGFFRNR